MSVISTVVSVVIGISVEATAAIFGFSLFSHQWSVSSDADPLPMVVPGDRSLITDN